MTKRTLTFLSVLALFVLATVIISVLSLNPGSVGEGDNSRDDVVLNEMERTWLNYRDEAEEVAEDMDLPAEYFLALIVLETSGTYPAGHRYEPGVFRRLKNLQEGKRLRYESVRRKHIKNASDEAIRNLATSWGPFQLMGYKCIAMDINVRDLRGKDGLYYGARWIAEEYGHLLRKGRYKDAFHYHNTGRIYPKIGAPRTHDPQYVNKGLQHMKYFRKRLDTE